MPLPKVWHRRDADALYPKTLIILKNFKYQPRPPGAAAAGAAGAGAGAGGGRGRAKLLVDPVTVWNPACAVCIGLRLNVDPSAGWTDSWEFMQLLNAAKLIHHFV